MRVFTAFAILALLASPVLADDQAKQQYQNLLTPLLSSGTDVLGTQLTYPQGPAKITAAIVTIPPGGTTGAHHHEVPLFAYILEGELTVYYVTNGKRTKHASDNKHETNNRVHIGTNTGTVPMKLLAVYMGGGTAANTVVDPAP